MKTISLKLPAALNAALDRAAQHGRQSKSEIVRAALAKFLTGANRARRRLNARELAGELVGCGAGPRDLSTNPKHMSGYGQ